MKKSALLISPNPEQNVSSWVDALKAQGFQVVLVHTLSETLFRLENEIYSVALYFEDHDIDLQAQISEGLPIRPFGATTPFILLGENRKPGNRVLLSSLLDQYFPLDTEPELLAEFADETHVLRKEKAKRGQLGPMTVPEILYRCSSFHLNGAIVVENQEEKCIIYLEDGHVAFASSNRDENRFGEFLVQRGVITQDQYERACRLLEESNKRFGKILVDEGIIKPQILKTLVQSQIKHIVFNVFDWSEGEFYILFNEKSGQDETIARFDIAPLVLEGVRFKMSEKFLEEKFEPFHFMVSLALPLEKLKRSIHLDKAELDFLRLVGEGRPMEELLNLSAYSRLESLQYIYAFQLLGYLNYEKSSRVRPHPPEMQKDRDKLFDELFSAKKPAPLEAEKASKLRKAVPAQPPRKEKTSRRWVAYAGWISGAVTILVVSTVVSIVTTFHMPSSPNGQTSESLSMKEPERLQIPEPTEPNLNVEVQPEESFSEVIEVEKTLRKENEKAQDVKEAATLRKEKVPAKTSVPENPTVEEVERAEVEAVAPKRVETQPKPIKKVAPRPRIAKKAPARKLNPFQMYYLRAEKERRSGRLHLSQRMYSKALQLRPSNTKVMLRLASLYFDLDQTRQAKRLYQRVIQLDPNSAEAYLSLGTIYQLENDQRRALSSYRRYMAVAPEDLATKARKIEVRRILRDLENQLEGIE